MRMIESNKHLKKNINGIFLIIRTSGVNQANGNFKKIMDYFCV